MPGFPGYDVERARLGIQGEALPFPAALAPEAEFTGRAERQPEYFVKMRLVTMPSNSNTGIVFRAKSLFYLRSRAAIGFDFFDHRRQPFRDLLGLLKPSLGVVVFEAERCDAPLALKRAELKRQQGKSANPLDEIELHRARDDLGIISKTWRTDGLRRKQRELLVHRPVCFRRTASYGLAAASFFRSMNLPVAWLRFVDGHHHFLRCRSIEEERNCAKNVPFLALPAA